MDEYSKSVKNVINQWDSDVKKMKESEEKYEVCYR